jgi:hypothetical protein
MCLQKFTFETLFFFTRLFYYSFTVPVVSYWYLYEFKFLSRTLFILSCIYLLYIIMKRGLKSASPYRKVLK